MNFYRDLALLVFTIAVLLAGAFAGDAGYSRVSDVLLITAGLSCVFGIVKRIE